MVQVDFRSRVPIYEQLVEKYKELIIKGILVEDEKLPSVRTLSKELGINPNTIQKAYRELERQEYIYSIKGKGSYVMVRQERKNNEEKNKIKDELKKIMAHAMYSGITFDEIKNLMDEVMKERGI
ncbi:GntR family transcriptional regulator [Oceanirhabdus sp. W0125-5]|uniref:GntR family transcriptional regulator n=1 Tax=Oceanirhabdus sp. W0125-5 TaxID=2999116 RepID=UPI0022F2AC17|nr:GntR family transcriptional regulator [Oceanirhabdus sp. W0125-5]WBW94672.1 GntR family transcriptional regulator [Oceanirhabdus sp. W0125-5]